ncbi:MAG: hypothetical protein QXD84_03820 [Thermoplasmata archaeon]
MITSRFHGDESELQRDWAMTKLKRRRLAVFIIFSVAALILFALLARLSKDFRTDPLSIPIYPALLAPLVFGIASIAAGAYFKSKLLALVPPQERPRMTSRYVRTGLVWIILFLIGLVFFLPLVPLSPGDNYLEAALATEGVTTVSGGSFVKLHFQGRDPLDVSRSEVTVRSLNNVSLNYFLMLREDAEAYESDRSVATASYDHAENTTRYVYRGTELEARSYTLIVQNEGDEEARIQYTILQRTFDELSISIVLFLLMYIAAVSGWVVYLRSRARKEALAPAAPPQIRVPGAAPAPSQPPVAPERMIAPAGPLGAPSFAPATPVPPSVAEPPATGVKQPIDCPRCGTRFEVFRGTGPTRIRCPTCGKEGTLAGVPPPVQTAPATAPAPGIAQESLAASTPPTPAAPQAYTAPTEPETVHMAPPPPAPPSAPVYHPAGESPAAIPHYPAPQYEPRYEAPPPPPPSAVEKRTIACPRCKQAFQIDKAEGPQQVKCPFCGKEGTIGKRAAPAPQAPIPAPTPATPSTAQAAGPAPFPPPPVTTQPPAAAPPPSVPPKMISCPGCRTVFPVTEIRRPIQVKCPSCGKEGVLRK